MRKAKSTPLKVHRAIAGTTKHELARKIGRSQTWISLLENGFVKPSAADKRKIARVLGVSQSVLDFDGGMAA